LSGSIETWFVSFFKVHWNIVKTAYLVHLMMHHNMNKNLNRETGPGLIFQEVVT